MAENLTVEKHVAIADESGKLLMFGSTMHDINTLEVSGLTPYQHLIITTTKSTDFERPSDAAVIRDKTLDEVIVQITSLSFAIYEEKRKSIFSRASAYTRGCEFTLKYLASLVNGLRENRGG
jgi:hypothetical protein